MLIETMNTGSRPQLTATKMAESAPPLVLVTGASGFVSTWLIKELLEKGEYRVRGTVRDKSKEEKVMA